jgi:prepilin-type N-terminal cleavage/methylation domain-containing protein
MARSEGFTLVELLLVVAILGLMGLITLGFGSELLARLEVETATRRLLVGLERGRSAAERQGRPCALSLNAGGWSQPSTGDLPACAGVPLALGEGLGPETALRLEHNLPPAVRFSSNGLVLDGGTVVVAHRATALSRCVVVSLPLGVTRVGLHGDGTCRPDPNL